MTSCRETACRSRLASLRGTALPVPRGLAVVAVAAVLAVVWTAPSSARNRLQEAAPAVESNPLPYTAQAIAKGRKHYLRHCQSCHGYDGRALENIDFEAADLTKPEAWRFGTTDLDIFRNTKEGAGQDMPPFGAKLEDREIWELVHYLRSIGPEKLRPQLVEEGTPER